ncbi:hypothetical protein [Brevundimonas diminuta]|uniref:hypothetical protein n=1 Tax=Brevundimonas diminuta TaxID=293 RepID=UPI0011781304|nr:hypothetical protein [Brevundimonas diminuta]
MNKFLPEMIFSDSSHNMARLYLSIMAYPGVHDGLEGSHGSSFCESIHNALVFSHKKNFKNKSSTLENFGYLADKRSFFNKIELGRKRIKRRMEILRIFNSSMLVALARGGGRDLSSYVNAIPSISQYANNNIDYWIDSCRINRSMEFLNRDVEEKKKDFLIRVIGPGRHVLPLSYGLYFSMKDFRSKIQNFDKVPLILNLYYNADLWVFDALRRAERFYDAAAIPGFYGKLTQDKLIRVRLENLQDNAP